MASSRVWLYCLILCWGVLSLQAALSYASVYTVTPHPDCPSGGESCLTIDEYAQGGYFDGDDNVTLLFLNGEHILTAQNLEINHKMFLSMAPDSDQSEVTILLMNETRIVVESVLEVKMSTLKLIALVENSTSERTPACLSLTDNGLLSVSRTSIDSCELSLQGETNVTITELIATKTSISLKLTQNSLNVAISESSFYFSILNINDHDSVLANQATYNATCVSALSIESCLVSNSLMSVTLAHTGYQMSMLDTSFTSNQTIATSDLETGIVVNIFETGAISVQLEKCRIIQNSYGIQFTTGGTSHVELNIDQCYIANNENFRGIVFLSQVNSSAVISTSVTSTTLVHNEFIQRFVDNYSGNATITVFNSTLRDGSGTYGLWVYDTYESANRYGMSNIFISVIKTVFDDLFIGVSLNELRGNCTVYMSDNEFRLSSSELFDASLIVHGVYSTGGRNTLNITNCLFSQFNSAIRVSNSSFRVAISNSVIERNEGIVLHILANSNDLSIVIKDCVFQENKGVTIGVDRLQSDNTRQTGITLNNVTFLNNFNPLPNGGIIQVDASITLRIEDSCVFRNNFGSPVQAFLTTVTLLGVVIFENNVATRGGAISLRFSTLILEAMDQNTSISFINNTATVSGGGIFIDQSSTLNIDADTGSSCFYALRLPQSYANMLDNIPNIPVTLHFRGNKAAQGGIDIYGATPNSDCYTPYVPSTSIQKRIFDTSSSISSISSDPKRVCLCDSSFVLQCADPSYLFYSIKRYPGERFNLSLAVVGFEFGTVTGPVYSFLQHSNNFTSSLGSGQDVRQVSNKKCNLLEFTVFSLNPTETLVLSTNSTLTPEQEVASNAPSISYFGGSIPYELLTAPVYVNIALLDCPPGFELVGNGRCDCNEEVREVGTNNCLLIDHTPYITRSGNQWIQPVMNRTRIVSSSYCPFSYCKQESVDLNLLGDTDEQCDLNHTGTLCGGCPPDLSLAIGSSKCLECSNNYGTLLLIAFAVAGILLVLLIKILDVTVAVGAINGLILYANIIWANQSALFPPYSQRSLLLQILRIFIAWLNLDFGIETCFIQHLNGYWKTWLQFTFPTYIWLLAGLIILTSHYSVRATKLFGNNSVSVLATLFLLSYAKLLRTLLDILVFTILNYPDGSRVVWSFDGNVSYFGLEHSILFVVAVVILLVLWLPYTLILLFNQWLRRFQWVNRMNPLFDSYLGALKTKHQYWIGLGLLTRLVLLLTSAIASTTVPFLTALMITSTASLLCLLVPNVYRQWQLGLLEGCFLVNMAVFSSGALFVEAQGGSKDSLACVSLGTTFILFVFIVGYHVWRRVQSLKGNQRRKVKKDSDDIKVLVPLHNNSSATFQNISVPTFREPLLESVVS